MRATILTHHILFDFKTIFIDNLKNNTDYTIKLPIIEFVKLAVIFLLRNRARVLVYILKTNFLH